VFLSWWWGNRRRGFVQ